MSDILYLFSYPGTVHNGLTCHACDGDYARNTDNTLHKTIIKMISRDGDENHEIQCKGESVPGSSGGPVMRLSQDAAKTDLSIVAIICSRSLDNSDEHYCELVTKDAI